MTIDILPTLSRIAGAKVPAGKIDGKDISPLLFGKAGAKSPHEAYFFYWNNELHGVRSGPWKLYFPHAYRTLEGSMAGKDGKPGPYKEARTGLELYNLDTDLSEKTDVAARNAEVVRRLQMLADRMRDDLGDSLMKKKGS
jgi:arylsulfatase A